MKTVEASGRTVDEAVAEALRQLGVPAEQAEVTILDPGARGWLGRIGGRPARVRVRARDPLEERVRAGREFVESVLEAFGLSVSIETRAESDGIVYIDVHGGNEAGLGAVIGRRGQTLDALQYLTNIVANKGGESSPRARIVLDVGGYRARRADALRRLAWRSAERAKVLRRKMVLEPMSALERRVVHLALQHDPGVETYSEGSEPFRRVVIVPKASEGDDAPERSDDRVGE
ncbi:MAG TPA: RNA-binding cell elongation regulator Jag/EloR [Limnochordia bacterium]